MQKKPFTQMGAMKREPLNIVELKIQSLGDFYFFSSQLMRTFPWKVSGPHLLILELCIFHHFND